MMVAQLVGERRVVGLAGRDGRGHHQAVAVLVLQPLAGQRGPPAVAPMRKPTGPGVGRRPDEVADPLESEHRIEGVERHHRYAPVGVAGGRRDPAGQRTGLGDALLQDLAVGVLGVGQQELVVDRLVELTERGVDLELPEHRVHAEGPGFVGNDRHHPVAEVPSSRMRSRSRLVKAMVVETSRPPEPSVGRLERRVARACQAAGGWW